MQNSILDYLERRADRHQSGRPAVIDDERSWSFEELETCAKRCASLLIRRAGVLRRPIAVLLPKSAAGIFSDLGIVYSGNFYMNLDVRSPWPRILAILNHVQPELVITSAGLAPQLAAAGWPEDRIFLVEPIFDDAIDFDPAALAPRLAGLLDTDPLCIINTSGSTGVPKSVVLNHRSTIDYVDACLALFPLDGSERMGSLSPFYFDPYTLELNLCLALGSTLVILPESLAAFPARLLERVVSQQVNFLFWVPSIMVNIVNQGLLDQFDLSALKTVFFIGEVFPNRPLNAWRAAAPHARFVNHYGPIEITVACTYYTVDHGLADDEPLPLGRPFPNTEILLLNEANQACATDEQGEICVRGSSLALGYWNDAERTARAFVQNPLNPHYPDRIYRTGDLGRWNARGELLFDGRRDFQIKHLGYRIELPEIEHHVLRLAGIRNACVLYHQHAREITLFYEAVNGSLTPAAIRARLAESLPKYMLPTAFHSLPELPRNANGKIDRQLLRAQLEAQ